MLVSRVQKSAIKQPRVTPREVCHHCDQNLNIKTLKKHRNLFRKSDGTWIKDSEEATSSEARSKLINR